MSAPHSDFCNLPDWPKNQTPEEIVELQNKIDNILEPQISDPEKMSASEFKSKVIEDLNKVDISIPYEPTREDLLGLKEADLTDEYIQILLEQIRDELSKSHKINIDTTDPKNSIILGEYFKLLMKRVIRADKNYNQFVKELNITLRSLFTVTIDDPVDFSSLIVEI